MRNNNVIENRVRYSTGRRVLGRSAHLAPISRRQTSILEQISAIRRRRVELAQKALRLREEDCALAALLSDRTIAPI